MLSWVVNKEKIIEWSVGIDALQYKENNKFEYDLQNLTILNYKIKYNILE